MDSIRVMTWNVWWRFGGNWRERERGILDVLRRVDPDVLGIQECWSEGAHSQADVIADELGGRYAAFVNVGPPPALVPLRDDPQRDVTMGVGLVSRWPIRRIAAAPLPSAGRHNDALVATIERPNGGCRVVVAGTSWEPDRLAETTSQFEQLQQLVSDGHDRRPNPSILLADLNYDSTQTPLAGLRLEDAWAAASTNADPRTLSVTNRFAPPDATGQYNRRIDHILYLPGTDSAVAIDARIIRDEPGGMPPSDHYPVVADLALGIDQRPESMDRVTGSP